MILELSEIKENKRVAWIIGRYLNKKRYVASSYYATHTIADVAKGAGVRAATVSEIFNGNVWPRLDTLLKIMVFLDADFAEMGEFVNKAIERIRADKLKKMADAAKVDDAFGS